MDKMGSGGRRNAVHVPFMQQVQLIYLHQSASLSMLTACRRTEKLDLEQDDAIGSQGTVLQKTPCARSPSQTSLAISTLSCRENPDKRFGLRRPVDKKVAIQHHGILDRRF
ncbi:unnamed protein product [Musa acuminata var. zebrina]